MANTIQDKEMDIVEFKSILARMKKVGIEVVKLLGGEPTLHTKLEEIIKLSLEDFRFVQIFTNGIISDTTTKFLLPYFPKVQFTFNVMTPGYLYSPHIRDIVNKRLLQFASKTNVTLSFTLDMHTDIRLILMHIPDDVLQKVHSVRIGFSNPVAKEKNYYSFDEFPKMGTVLYDFVSKIRARKSKSQLFLNCGFTRCMFTDQQYEYIVKNGVSIDGWGCFGKESSMDIATDATAFHCFPLSSLKRESMSLSLPVIDKNLVKKRYEYWKDIVFTKCKSCPFYGHVPGKCPGPCIAFRINDVNKDEERCTNILMH